MRNYPRVYTSFMPNAPFLNGVPGSLLDVLKKCLIGGWTPFDVTNIVVNNGVATLNFSYANKSLPDYCILSISGCVEPMLNSEVTIYQGGDTYGFFKTTVADGTYGGTIKAAPTPAGWDLLFSGTNEAILRSTNLESSRVCVKVSDTNATTCSFDFANDATSLVRLVESAKVDIPVDRCILKSTNAVASDYRGWAIIADNTTAYILTDIFTPSENKPHTRDMLQAGRLSFFGDYISNDPEDVGTFASFFNPIDVGDTNLTPYVFSSPCVSGSWEENTSYCRPLVKMPKTRFVNWSIACFNVSSEMINPSNRTSGSISNIDFSFITDLEKSYRKTGVWLRTGGPRSSVAIFGNLPGIRYCDYNIRPLFLPFTTSENSETGDVFIYVPTEKMYRATTIDDTWGFSPFVINKKWGP